MINLFDVVREFKKELQTIDPKADTLRTCEIIYHFTCGEERGMIMKDEDGSIRFGCFKDCNKPLTSLIEKYNTTYSSKSFTD